MLKLRFVLYAAALVALSPVHAQDALDVGKAKPKAR
jgi:hypothetical protein